MTKRVIKFWFDFGSERNTLPIGVNRGCGVTAYNHDDAISILRELVFLEKEIPLIEKIVEDIDVSELDKDHVLVNMGDVLRRGVWYPLGYNQ